MMLDDKGCARGWVVACDGIITRVWLQPYSVDVIQLYFQTARVWKYNNMNVAYLF